MIRTTPEQENITLSWLEETKRIASITQILKGIFYTLIFVFPFSMFSSIFVNNSSDNHFVFIFKCTFCVVMFLTVWLLFRYIKARMKRIEKQIKRGEIINISSRLPPTLSTFSSEILDRFQIPGQYIEFWVNHKSLNSSPSIILYENKYHLILPLGFLKLLLENETHARQILAHEFSHIRQRDTDFLIEFKIYFRISLILFIPCVLALILILLVSIKTGLLISILPISYNFIISIALLLFARSIIHRSERIADLGSVVAGSSSQMIHTLQTCSSDYQKRKLFALHPDINWRIDKLTGLENMLPGSTLLCANSTCNLQQFNPQFLPLPLLIFSGTLIYLFPALTISGFIQGLCIDSDFETILIYKYKLIIYFIFFILGLVIAFWLVSKKKKGLIVTIGVLSLIIVPFIFMSLYLTGTNDLFFTLWAYYTLTLTILYSITGFRLACTLEKRPVRTIQVLCLVYLLSSFIYFIYLFFILKIPYHQFPPLLSIFAFSLTFYLVSLIYFSEGRVKRNLRYIYQNV